MQFGVCGGPDLAGKAADAGYDYFEWQTGALLQPREDKAVFLDALKQARAAPLPCPVVNCFVPGDLKIVGPAADLDALRAYVTTACERANTAEVDTIVFGSGGARGIPEGCDPKIAHDQIVAFLEMCGPIAEHNNVTIVIEPLNKSECNIINSVGEGAGFVREVSHPNVQLLVDGYHWAKDGDSVEDIVVYGSMLKHVHIATRENRQAPGREECDCGLFFQALKKGGYDGRVSIEGGIPEPETDLPRALELMKKLAG